MHKKNLFRGKLEKSLEKKNSQHWSTPEMRRKLDNVRLNEFTRADSINIERYRSQEDLLNIDPKLSILMLTNRVVLSEYLYSASKSNKRRTNAKEMC